MTREQRDILKRNLEDDGNEYHIVSIEYPCGYHDPRTGDARQDGVKIVTREAESQRHYTDVYSAEGTTAETRSFFSR